MRSLWRRIAARWLGGQATETLTGDAVLHDLLTPEHRPPRASFAVHRRSTVSHHAMMSRQHSPQPDFETAEGRPAGAESED